MHGWGVVSGSMIDGASPMLWKALPCQGSGFLCSTSPKTVCPAATTRNVWKVCGISRRPHIWALTFFTKLSSAQSSQVPVPVMHAAGEDAKTSIVAEAAGTMKRCKSDERSNVLDDAVV